MSDTAEPVATVEEPSGSSTTGGLRAAPPRASARATTYGRAGAVGWLSSEASTLVCAVSVAVALGISCGAWINARLAAGISITPPAPSRLLPAAVATGHKTNENPAPTESVSPELKDTSAEAGETAPLHDSAEPPDAETSRKDPAATSDKGSATRRGVVISAPAVSVASPPERVERRPTGAPDAVKKVAAGQGRAVPCALYASAGSLTIRTGGAAPLVVGGPGEAGRVTVTTPDWADVAVLSEGRAGGNGWVRYSVRSLSKRAGVYTVRVASPCGSQNVTVTVTRP